MPSATSNALPSVRQDSTGLRTASRLDPDPGLVFGLAESGPGPGPIAGRPRPPARIRQEERPGPREPRPGSIAGTKLGPGSRRRRPARSKTVPKPPAPTSTSTGTSGARRLRRQAVQGPRRISGSASSRACTASIRDKTALLLPDGQIGISSTLVPTDEPFVARDERATCGHGCRQGPYAEYQVLKTHHYVIFYKSTAPFAGGQRPAAGGPVPGLDRSLPQARDPGPRDGIPPGGGDLRDRARLPGPQAGRPAGAGVLRDLHQPDLLLRAIGPGPEQAQDGDLLKPQTVAHEGRTRSCPTSGCNPGSAPGPSG